MSIISYEVESSVTEIPNSDQDSVLANRLSTKNHSYRALNWLVEIKPLSGLTLSGQELSTSIHNTL